MFLLMHLVKSCPFSFFFIVYLATRRSNRAQHKLAKTNKHMEVLRISAVVSPFSLKPGTDFHYSL